MAVKEIPSKRSLALRTCLLLCILFVAAVAFPCPAAAKTRQSYPIVYHLNGGTQPRKQVERVQKGKTLKVAKLRKPTRRGYTFEGWYSNKRLTKQAKSIKGVAKRSKRTLYAKWKRITYKIVYKLNGGTQPARQTTRVNKYAKLKVSKLKKPTRVGYDFDGWYANAELTKRASLVRGTSDATKRTLYARWRPIAYSITYDMSCGQTSQVSLPTNAPTTYTIEQSISLPTPTRAGYSFIGWYSDAALTQGIDTIEAGTTGAVRLYARWKERYFIAHRGYHVGVPENSIAAFEACAAKGFSHVETDVRFTRDGVPVLSHDATVSVWDSPAQGDDDSLCTQASPLEEDVPLAREEDPLVEEDVAAEEVAATGKDAAAGEDVTTEEDAAAKEDLAAEEVATSGEDITAGGDVTTDVADGEGTDVILAQETAEGAAEGRSVKVVTISAYTNEELQNMEFVTPTAADGRGIATFEEFLDVCVAHGLKPHVDVKDGSQEQVSLLVELVRAHGLLDSSVWTTGKYELLGYLAQADSALYLEFYNNSLSSTRINRVIEICAGHSFGVSTRLKSLTSAVVKRCKEARLPLGLYDVVDETYALRVDPYVHAFAIDGVAAPCVPATC